MDDYISRQAAIELWEKYHPTIAVDAMRYDAELRQLPAAQPEIIRCEECKHYDKRYKPSICVRKQYGITRKPDWFCADAERREDEQNKNA